MFGGMIGFLVLTYCLPDMDEQPSDVSSKQSELTSSSEQSTSETTKDSNGSSSHSHHSLEMTGLVTALGISLHNFPEGLVVFNATVIGLFVCSLL